jgi:signal peptide peptidase SppA
MLIAKTHSLGDKIDIGAVEKQLGRKLENTRSVEIRGTTAVVPINGPIIRYANFFSEISGATSVETIAKDFNTALNDPNVESILLNIDSPGGSTNGINELSAMMRAARGKKRIVAYSGAMVASAAYWIASAADEIIIDKTAMAGSIGVIAAVSAGKESDTITFISNQSPLKHVDPKTKKGAAEIQGLINEMGSIFVQTMADNRGVSVEKVLADFGKGGVQLGAAAVESGLVDRIGSFEQVIDELNEKVTKPQTKTTNANAKTEIPIMAEEIEGTTATLAPLVINREYLNANHVGLINEIKAEGAEAERTRHASLDVAFMPGHEKLLAEAKGNPETDAGAFALQMCAAEKQTRTNTLGEIKANAPKPVVLDVDAVEPVKVPKVDKNTPIEERAKAEWDADAGLRNTFIGGYDNYLSARVAEDNEQIKTQGK